MVLPLFIDLCMKIDSKSDFLALNVPQKCATAYVLSLLFACPYCHSKSL
jgi:hypothetical protein